MHDPTHLTDELRLIREQIRRFVSEEVVPHGETWEQDGMVPRAVLRRMGELGFLAMRHPGAYGGASQKEQAKLLLKSCLANPISHPLKARAQDLITEHWPPPKAEEPKEEAAVAPPTP